MARVWSLGAVALVVAGCTAPSEEYVVVQEPIRADDVYIAPKGQPAGYGAAHGARVTGATARYAAPVGCYPGAPTLYRGTLYCTD